MGSLHETNPSLWVTTTPSDVSYSPWVGGVDEFDVAIVGAGITGLSAALVLAERGARVVVLEAGAVCSGATGYTTAKVTSLHGLTYARLLKNRGEDVARAYADANQAGLEYIAGWVKRYRIECEFSRRQAFTYTCDPHLEPAIADEAHTATRLGLPAVLTTRTDLPYDVVTAVRFDNQAQFHPRRYCLGLAEAITAHGGMIHEHTRVVGVHPGSPCRVATHHGEISARAVVLATHLPIADRGGFFAKTTPSRSYAIAVRLSEGSAVPRNMYLSADDPTRSIRSAMDDSVVLVGGESHPVGKDADTEQRYRALEQWTERVFAVDEILARWSAQDYMPVDGTPFIGRQLPKSPVFVATGFAKWGMTNGTAAGLLLGDLIDGKTNEWLAAFDATRLRSPLTSRSTYLHNATSVLGHLIGDRLRRPPRFDDVSLAEGQGAIVELHGDKVAVSRDRDGQLRTVSRICRHLGCVVAYNEAEQTWDCPCHGSRYSADGHVIEGPAVDDLDARALPDS